MRPLGGRLVALLPVVFGITLLVFLLNALGLGDPARAAMGQRADPEALERVRQEYALDRPLPIPSLIVTGEPALERVVPPDATLAYRTWLPDATVVTMPRTGHGGTVTRPQEFARCVGDWLASLPPARSSRRPSAPPMPQEPPRAHRVS